MDTEGLVMRARVHSAVVFDRDGIKPLLDLAPDRFLRLSHPWLDAGYNGKGKGKDWVEKTLGLTAEVVRPSRRWVWVPTDQEPPRPAFTVLPRRWVIERTFSWLSQNRRISKDYERLPESSLGGVRLRGYDAAHGEEVGPPMKLFGRFLCAKVEA